MSDSNLKYPSIAVIDRAIEVIKSGDRMFSCNALQVGIKSVLNESWYSPVSDKYLEQYTMWVFEQDGGHAPYWWDGRNTPANKKARINALEGFRQACIDAAKR